MYEILMVIYLIVALGLVGFILIQQGKGAGMGSSFGAGASGTVFGASGSGNFLTKTTAILAIVFFGVALALGNLTSDKDAKVDNDSLFPADATEQVSATDIPDGGQVEQSTSDLPVENQSDLPKNEELPVQNEAATEESGPEKTEDDTKDTDDTH